MPPLARPTNVVIGPPWPGGGGHPYFDLLAARSDVHVNLYDGQRCVYSLRDQTWLDAHYKGGNPGWRSITYDPANDTDPDAQDAAKVVIRPLMASLPGQNSVYCPVGTEDGHRYLVTWDAFWTPSYIYANSGYEDQKTFQFSRDYAAFTYWIETKTAYYGNASGRTWPGFDRTKHIGQVYTRYYQQLGPGATDQQPFSPSVGFLLWPRRWSRYWYLYEQRANDWGRLSMWMADSEQPVTPLFSALPVQDALGKYFRSFFLEFNKSGGSTHPNDLVCYVRNVVVLADPSDPIESLLLVDGLA